MGNAPASRSRQQVDIGGERADVVFEVLAHPYRRFVLWYLDEADGQSTVPQLAREIEAWRSRSAESERGVSGVATITLALRHTHLPKLDDASMIDHDPDSNRVWIRDGAEDALVHLGEPTL